MTVGGCVLLFIGLGTRCASAKPVSPITEAVAAVKLKYETKTNRLVGLARVCQGTSPCPITTSNKLLNDDQLGITLLQWMRHTAMSPSFPCAQAQPNWIQKRWSTHNKHANDSNKCGGFLTRLHQSQKRLRTQIESWADPKLAQKQRKNQASPLLPTSHCTPFLLLPSKQPGIEISVFCLVTTVAALQSLAWIYFTWQNTQNPELGEWVFVSPLICNGSVSVSVQQIVCLNGCVCVSFGPVSTVGAFLRPTVEQVMGTGCSRGT